MEAKRLNRTHDSAKMNANDEMNVTVISVDTEVAETTRSSCCSVGQHTKLVLGTLVGIALGVGVSFAEPDDATVAWVAFPGKLFLRALSCLVIPLIFCNMVTGVAEVSQLGGTGKVGGLAVGLYMFTTFLAVGMGAIFTAIFMQFYVVEGENGGELVEGGGLADTIKGRTVSETIMGIFDSLVPVNITQAFSTPDILSVVVFATCFGMIAGNMRFGEGETNKVLEFMDQMARLFNLWIGYIIYLAPYAITFMIAGALAGSDDFVALMQNIGVFVCVVLLGLVGHVLISLSGLFFAMSRKNPYTYMGRLSPAYMFAFGSASSAATLPLSLKAVDETTDIPSPVSKFVLSLGSTINMDGSGVYFVAATVFLAIVSGNSDLLTPAAYFNIVLMCTVGAVGASPIPNAGLVMILTIWESCFPGVATPVQISYLIAIDWFLDRCITVTNVAGDTMICQMVASMTGLEDVATLEKNEDVIAKEEHRVQRVLELSVTKSNLKSKMSNSFKSVPQGPANDVLSVDRFPAVVKPARSMPPLQRSSKSKSDIAEEQNDDQLLNNNAEIV